MEKEFKTSLNEYLAVNGVDMAFTSNKEILKELKKIVFDSRVCVDLEDLKHSKELEKGINNANYIDTVNNLEINVQAGLYFISTVNGIVREERKLRIKSGIKKVLRIK